MDISAASASSISLNGVKNMLSTELAQCSQKSSATPLTLVDPVFESDDLIDYEIGSGLYNVAFSDWYVSGNTCTIDFEYRTMESVAGVETFDLSLSDPTSLNLNVGLQTSDLSLTDIHQTVTVLA